MEFLTMEKYIEKKAKDIANLQIERLKILAKTFKNLEKNITNLLNEKTEAISFDDILKEIAKIKIIDQKINLIDAEIKATILKAKLNKKRIIILN